MKGVQLLKESDGIKGFSFIWEAGGGMLTEVQERLSEYLNWNWDLNNKEEKPLSREDAQQRKALRSGVLGVRHSSLWPTMPWGAMKMF